MSSSGRVYWDDHSGDINVLVSGFFTAFMLFKFTKIRIHSNSLGRSKRKAIYEVRIHEGKIAQGPISRGLTDFSKKIVVYVDTIMVYGVQAIASMVFRVSIDSFMVIGVR